MDEGTRSVSRHHQPKATSFSDSLCTALHHKDSDEHPCSVTSLSLQNENWDEDVRTSSASAPNSAWYKLSKKNEQSVMCNINDDVIVVQKIAQILLIYVFLIRY